MKKSIITVSLLLGLPLSAGLAQADGFHYQITTSSRLMADAAGNLSAIGMDWVYDLPVSEVLMEEEDLSDAARADTLRNRAGEVLADLLERSYNTQLSVEGQPPLEFKPVGEYGMELSPQGNLKMHFLLQLPEPLDVRGKTVLMEMSDPDGVATINFPESNQVTLDDALASQCAAPVIEKQKTELPNNHTVVIETMVLSCG